MLSTKDHQNKDISQKPFAQVRIVVDPPEGLKALDLKLKKPTLFVEVIQGDENGVLNKQWIPLFMAHLPKTPLSDKTHYGKKMRPAQASAISTSPAIEQNRHFDIQAITNFIFPRTQKNKYTPFMLPGPNAKNALTLCIPTNSGECQLSVTPEGALSINALPANLDLKIETPYDIKTGNDLKCRALHVSTRNIQNTHSLSADNIALNATQTITNTHKISSKNTLKVSAKVALINKTHAAFKSDGKLEIDQTPLVTNQGTLEGNTDLAFKTPTCLNNEATLKSKGLLDLNLKGQSQNQGLFSSKTLHLSGEAFQNSPSGKILATDIDIVGNTVLDNQGLIEAEKALQVNTATPLKNHVSGTLRAKEQLDFNVESLKNEGLIASSQTLKGMAKREIENTSTGQITAQHFELLCDGTPVQAWNKWGESPLAPIVYSGA